MIWKILWEPSHTANCALKSDMCCRPDICLKNNRLYLRPRRPCSLKWWQTTGHQCAVVCCAMLGCVQAGLVVWRVTVVCIYTEVTEVWQNINLFATYGLWYSVENEWEQSLLHISTMSGYCIHSWMVMIGICKAKSWNWASLSNFKPSIFSFLTLVYEMCSFVRRSVMPCYNIDRIQLLT